MWSSTTLLKAKSQKSNGGRIIPHGRNKICHNSFRSIFLLSIYYSLIARFLLRKTNIVIPAPTTPTIDPPIIMIIMKL